MTANVLVESETKDQQKADFYKKTSKDDCFATRYLSRNRQREE